MRPHLIGGGLLAAIGAVILVVALNAGNASPRDWIVKNYTRVAADTYRTTDPPLEVAGRIVKRFEPTDRAYVPTGVFLRYRRLVVAVLPEGRGSRITLDTPARGYARYHSSVGGRWGGPGGRVSTFRGGGPGEGK